MNNNSKIISRIEKVRSMNESVSLLATPTESIHMNKYQSHDVANQELYMSAEQTFSTIREAVACYHVKLQVLNGGPGIRTSNTGSGWK